MPRFLLDFTATLVDKRKELGKKRPLTVNLALARLTVTALLEWQCLHEFEMPYQVGSIELFIQPRPFSRPAFGLPIEPSRSRKRPFSPYANQVSPPETLYLKLPRYSWALGGGLGSFRKGLVSAKIASCRWKGVVQPRESV